MKFVSKVDWDEGNHCFVGYVVNQPDKNPQEVENRWMQGISDDFLAIKEVVEEKAIEYNQKFNGVQFCFELRKILKQFGGSKNIKLNTIFNAGSTG